MTTQEWIKRNLSYENVISPGDCIDVYFDHPPKSINEIVREAYHQGFENGEREENERIKGIIINLKKEFGL